MTTNRDIVNAKARQKTRDPNIRPEIKLSAWARGFWCRLCVSCLGAAAALVVLTPDTAHADWLADLEAPFRNALDSGGLGFAFALGVIFLAGLVTSLTPCVYPMIAITVSVFGARQVKSKWEGAMLSSFFVLGMACLFTPLGIIVAMTGGVFGSALASPWVLGGLALLFLTFALSMFGAFELNLPAGLRNRLAQTGGVGKKGAFLLGLVSALIAAPCTGPVIGVLLSWVATTGNVTFGALSLFVYSLGLGLLFWCVGTFAVTLPKSGKWLEWIKSIFGVVMLVMALFYIRDLLPFALPSERSSVWIGVSAAVFAVGLAMGAIHLSYHTPKLGVRIRKTVGVLFAVVGAVSMVCWLQALPAGAKIQWAENYDQARKMAKDSQKPLLVDFGASWCGACGELDRHTFSDPRVVAAARDFIAVRIDLSPGEDTPDKRAVLASYSQKGLPLIVLHDRNGEEVKRITSFVEPDTFLADMREASVQ